MPTVVIAYSTFPNIGIEQKVLEAIGAEIIQFSDFNNPRDWEVASRADALMVTNQRVSSELIAKLRGCKIICRVGTGLDAIDIPAATAQGIWVTNVPDYAVDEVSTHTIALLLNHARQLPGLSAMVKERVWWEPTRIEPIRRLRGQVLGLLGYGRIGQAVAVKGRGLGLEVCAYDPYATIAPGVDGAQAVDLPTLLRTSDYLSLHTPLTNDTRHIIDAGALAQMKPTAYIINSARGLLIDEVALLEAVQSGKIAGAALDVLITEPPTESGLLHEPHIFITPHAAWYSTDAEDEVRLKGAEEVARVLGGENPRAAVNRIEPI